MVKILLLAPTSIPQGGIARWTKLLLTHSTGRMVEYKTIDTSVHYRVLGGKTGFVDRIHGLKTSFLRGMVLLSNLLIYKPDIVYFTCSPSVGFAFRDAPQILLCKLFGKKVVIHLRGGSLSGFWGGGFLRRWLANVGSKLADYIFVITRDCEVVARKKFGNHKVVYVPNFIDTVSQNETGNDVPREIRKDEFNVLHVAFQCRTKGTFEIIQSAKELPDDVNMLLIGVVSEENRVAIEDAIEKNGVAGKVHLLGVRHKPQLWSYYRSADMFLFPSYSEGFPNVIMEAMLCQLPIITTDVGNIADMIDAYGDCPAGLLLKDSNPPKATEIAGLILKLKDDKPLRDQLAENGYARVKEKYSTDIVIPALEIILHAIHKKEDVLKVSERRFVQKGF